MPTYVYKCPDCQHIYDYVQSIHDDALSNCVLCDGGRVQRCVTAPIYCYTINDPTTLYHYAERNTDKLGKGYIENKEGQEQEKRKQKDKENAAKIGATLYEKTGAKPWWRQNNLPGIGNLDKALDTSKISNIQMYRDWETGKI